MISNDIFQIKAEFKTFFWFCLISSLTKLVCLFYFLYFEKIYLNIMKIVTLELIEYKSN